MTTERPSLRCTPVSETQYDYDDGSLPSEAIVRALSDAEGVPPLDLDPLYDAVDPDAIDRIFGWRDGPASTDPTVLEFTVSGWRVVVGHGRVLVCDPDEAPDRVSAESTDARSTDA